MVMCLQMSFGYVFFLLLDYTIVVETSDTEWAGTDATVKVRVHGTLGDMETALPDDTKYFERGK